MMMFSLVGLLTGANTSAAELERLDWLAGHWVDEDGAYEEVWLAPAGGTMVGSFRWIFPDERQVLEFLVIDESEAGIAFRFKHFERSFEPWEKQQPNTYQLSSLTDQSVTFIRTSDNTNVPYSLSYTRDGDRLLFIGESEPGTPSDPLRLEFRRKQLSP